MLAGVDLSLGRGDRVALVGRNGSGKSTLLKIAAGLVESDSGQRFVQPGTTISYLAQEPDLGGYSSVLSYVQAAIGSAGDPYRAPYLLEQLGLEGDRDPAFLSGGEKRRAALARLLAPGPDVLLLDEPTNHLDLPAIQWLERELKSLASAMVIISHDRAFLGATTGKTLWLDRGRVRQFERGFSRFENWRDRILEEEMTALHKLERKIAAEEHWLRYGVTARRKRNVGRLDRLHRLRQDRAGHVHAKLGINMSVGKGNQAGTMIIQALDICKALGERTLVKDFSLKILRGDRVAIVGANGAGKTTLVNLLTGTMKPDAGEVRRGSGVRMTFLEQNRDSLDPETSLKDALTGGGRDSVVINGVEKHVIGYMKDFLFAPEQLNTPLKALSGGERARIMLARCLALPSNLLVLDEPTNDLDLETLDLLQETITDYPGTVILVSHDRDFIDRIATITLIGEGDGTWTSCVGGYSDMLSLRGEGVQARGPFEPADPGDAARTGRAAGSRKADRSGSGAPSRVQKPPRRQKLSFNQLHALKTLPDRMQVLERQIEELGMLLDDPGLYGRDPEGFSASSRALEQKRQEYERLQNQWLELEILREELQGG